MSFTDCTEEIAAVLRDRLREPALVDWARGRFWYCVRAETEQEYIEAVKDPNSNACTHWFVPPGAKPNTGVVRTAFHPGRRDDMITVHEFGHVVDWFAGEQLLGLRWMAGGPSCYYSEHHAAWRQLCNTAELGVLDDAPRLTAVGCNPYVECFAEYFTIRQFRPPYVEHYNIISQGICPAHVQLVIDRVLAGAAAPP